MELLSMSGGYNPMMMGMPGMGGPGMGGPPGIQGGPGMGGGFPGMFGPGGL